MANFWENPAVASYLGKIGSGINTAGNFLGSVGVGFNTPTLGVGQQTTRAPDLNLSENLQSIGGYFNPTVYASEGSANADPQFQNILDQTTGQPTIIKTGNNPTPIPTNNNPTNVNGDDAARALGYKDLADYNQQMSLQKATNPDQIQNTINSGFNDIFGQLDNMAGLIPGQQAQAEQGVQNTYGSINNSLTTAQDNANKTIDINKQQIQGSTDKSVTDIQNSLRNLLKGAYGQVGALGAGNSSVAQTMIPYAFSKQFGQQRANVQGQANSQFTDLAKKQLDVQTTFSQQKTSLDTWEQGQLDSIRADASAKLTEINNAKINATGQRLSALNSLQTNIMNQAYSTLQTIQQNAAQFKNNIQTWAMDRLGTLQDSGNMVNSAGQYTPTALQYSKLAGLGSTTGQNTNSDFAYNPAAYGKKIDPNTGMPMQ